MPAAPTFTNSWPPIPAGAASSANRGFVWNNLRIEESNTPYLDYPVGTMYQPNEHELQLARGSLLELDEALINMHGTPKRLALRDFSVWPSGPSFGSPDENDAYKKREEKQRAEMWDHNKQ